jgi:hypothetical protein
MSSSAAVRKILDSLNFVLKPRMVSGFMGMFYLLADYYNETLIIFPTIKGAAACRVLWLKGTFQPFFFLFRGLI